MNPIPPADLDKDNAYARIEEARLRLDTMAWYLQAKAVDDFFKQWPDLKMLYVENCGNDEAVRLFFMAEEWADGVSEEGLPADERKRFNSALEAMGDKMTSMLPGRISRRVNALINSRYLMSNEVIEQFGHLWRNSNAQEERFKAKARWEALLVEIGNARLDAVVDPAQNAPPKSVPRM